MIHPSYVELMRVVNDDVVIGEEPVVNSRYSIVCATAKRARQLISGMEPLHTDVSVYRKKPLSIAVDELYKGELRIITEDEAEEKQEELIELKEKNRLVAEQCKELKKGREDVDDEDTKDVAAEKSKAAPVVSEIEDENFDDEDIVDFDGDGE